MARGNKRFRFEWILLAVVIVMSTSILGYGYKAVDVERNAPAIDAEIQHAVVNLETMAALMEELKNSGVPDRDTINSMLKAVLRQNPSYLAAWTSWEPNALDNLDYQHINNVGHDETGRFIPYWNRIDGQIEVVPLQSVALYGEGNHPSAPVASGSAAVSAPIAYTSQGKRLHKIVVSAPVHFDNQVAGIVGIDIALPDLAEPLG